LLRRRLCRPEGREHRLDCRLAPATADFDQHENDRACQARKEQRRQKADGNPDPDARIDAVHVVAIPRRVASTARDAALSRGRGSG
jgi:hypothetical protein